jgi:hypothetical protein
LQPKEHCSNPDQQITQRLWFGSSHFFVIDRVLQSLIAILEFGQIAAASLNLIDRYTP